MTNSTPTPADALIAALHEPGRENLLDLVRNPLRLTLLCMTWDGSSLPETQAELYERYLRKIYEWNRNLHELEDHAQRCGTNTTKLKQNLNQQLGELAKAALNLPQERFRLSQALVEQHLGEESDRTSLAYLALRLGWLNRVGKDGRGDGIFAFYHATFQEYFAALAVEDWDYFLPHNHGDRPVPGKVYRIFEKQWKQVILLWLGRGDVGDEKKEGFIRALVEFEGGCGMWNFEKVDRGYYEYRAYLLAAAGINEFNACSLSATIIRQIVMWAFGYFNIEKKEWLRYVSFIENGAKKNIPKTNYEYIRFEISQLLKLPQYSEDIDTVDLPIQILVKTVENNEKAIAELVEIIKATSNEDIRLKAAQTLGEINPENSQAIAVLINILNTTKRGKMYWNIMDGLGKIGYGNLQVIDYLKRAIEITEDKKNLAWVAECLGTVNPGNFQAISTLIKVLQTSEDIYTLFAASSGLKNIAQGNLQAINGLIKNIEINGEDNFSIGTLGEIGHENLQAIHTLVKLIEDSKNENICCLAAESLWNIDPCNKKAIDVLIKLVKAGKNEEIRMSAADVLGRIIDILIELVKASKNEETRISVAHVLERIQEKSYYIAKAQENSYYIAKAFIEILKTSEDMFACSVASHYLGKIGQGYIAILDQWWGKPSPPTFLPICGGGESEASRIIVDCYTHIIDDLVEIMKTTENELTDVAAAYSLAKIDTGNLYGLPVLLKVIKTTRNESILSEIIFGIGLGEIGQGNSQVIATLVEILKTNESESIRRAVVYSLGVVSQGDPQAVDALINTLKVSKDQDTLETTLLSLSICGHGEKAIAELIKIIKTTEDQLAASCLAEILTTRQQYAGVVTALKDCLSNEVYQNNFDRFYECYKLIWNCAENLSYPDFYQAWHNPPSTPHPEVEDNTPATPTSFTQQCNLALLPQILNQALQTHPLNRQPICIDGSRFSDPSNPALQIYTTLKKAGCPASPDSKPRTIAELQAYCEDDLSDHPIALILYEEPTDPPPQGLDIAVLNQLARLSHPPIAVVVPQPLPECRLPQFLESDPDVMATLLQWLQNLDR